jgi:hypothetical protein
MLGKAVPLIVLSLFGAVWIWGSYALWIGCENACSEGLSLLP